MKATPKTKLKLMIKSYRCLKIIIVLIPTLVLFIVSCRKADIIKSEISLNSEEVTIKFFSIPAGIDPEIKKVAANLQKQKGFLNYLPKFIDQNGVPKWDKTIFKVSNKLNINSRGSGDSSKSQGILLIPLQSATANKIQSYITCYKHNDSSYSYRLYNKDSLDNVKPANDTSKARLLNAQAVFGYFEKSVNGKDSILVNNGNTKGYIKNADIKFSVVGGNRSSLRNNSNP